MTDRHVWAERLIVLQSITSTGEEDDMAEAWIGITHPDWHSHFVDIPESTVDFWRPSQGTFAAIPRGGRFFCLVRGSPHESRVFGAMGFFREQHLMTAPEAWEAFGRGTGANSLDDLIERFDLPLDRPVRHIVLEGFRVADAEVTTGEYYR